MRLSDKVVRVSIGGEKGRGDRSSFAVPGALQWQCERDDSRWSGVPLRRGLDDRAAPVRCDDNDANRKGPPFDNIS